MHQRLMPGHEKPTAGASEVARRKIVAHPLAPPASPSLDRIKICCEDKMVPLRVGAWPNARMARDSTRPDTSEGEKPDKLRVAIGTSSVRSPYDRGLLIMLSALCAVAFYGISSRSPSVGRCSSVVLEFLFQSPQRVRQQF